MSLNPASKHIKVLERTGLVRRRVSGRDHYLKLAPEPLGQAAGWLETYRAFWEPRLEVALRCKAPRAGGIYQHAGARTHHADEAGRLSGCLDPSGLPVRHQLASGGGQVARHARGAF